MLSDFTYALRQLAKTPLVTAAAICSLALAFGANTALFSIFDRLVLRPHAYAEPATLVRVWSNNPTAGIVGPGISWPKYELLRDQQTVFAHLGASTFSSFAYSRDGGEPEQLSGLRVTPAFFKALGVEPARGRNFNPDEDGPGAPPVAVVSHEFWQTHLGARSGAVGEIITLNGVAHTVIGILPPLTVPFNNLPIFITHAHEPLGLSAEQVRVGANYLQLTARLKPGISFQRANEEVARLGQRYEQAFPNQFDAKNPAELRTLTEELAGNLRPTMNMLLGAVAAVLLIACANVSNLFLARLSARQKEIAVRLALGATRAHLIRQFLIESLLFAVIATLLGLALGRAALVAVEQLAANQLAPNTTFSLSGPTLLFSAALCGLTALGVGLVPALSASRLGLAEVLKDATRGAAGGVRGGRFRAGLIVAEVALAVVLLIGSALLLVSFYRLQRTPPGLNPAHAAYAFASAPVERYKTTMQQAEFFERVIERLKAVPRVQFAAVTTNLPLNGGARAPYTVFGDTIKPLTERPLASLLIVTGEFFQVLQIPLREGRTMNARDREGTPRVCLINESFARRLFPNQSALGKILLRGRDAEVKNEIIGVVGDVKSNGLGAPPPDSIYYAFLQMGKPGAAIVARLDGDPEALQGIMRTAVAEVDRQQPIAFFSTMENLLKATTGFQLLVAGLTGIFAGVALLLTAVGIYSVLAYSVGQRTNEIGVRMALGASQNAVVALILGQGLRLVGIGLGAGLAFAAGASWLIRSLLFGVNPFNPLLYAGVAVVFLGIAVVACLLPSLRAARIDPIIALRSE